MAERGARGVKLHPVLQKFEPNETALQPVYQACTELGLAVLSHTGPARDGVPFAEVPAFAPMLAEFPASRWCWHTWDNPTPAGRGQRLAVEWTVSR